MAKTKKNKKNEQTVKEMPKGSFGVEKKGDNIVLSMNFPPNSYRMEFDKDSAYFIANRILQACENEANTNGTEQESETNI